MATDVLLTFSSSLEGLAWMHKNPMCVVITKDRRNRYRWNDKRLQYEYSYCGGLWCVSVGPTDKLPWRAEPETDRALSIDQVDEVINDGVYYSDLHGSVQKTTSREVARALLMTQTPVFRTAEACKNYDPGIGDH